MAKNADKKKDSKMAVQQQARQNDIATTDWMDWLTPEEAALIMRVSKDTIIRQCEQHALKAVKLGSIWRISHRGLQELAEANFHPKENYIAPLLTSDKSNSKNNQ